MNLRNHGGCAMCRRGVSMGRASLMVHIHELKGKIGRGHAKSLQTGRRASPLQNGTTQLPIHLNCTCPSLPHTVYAMGRMRVMAAGTDDDVTPSP